MVDSNDRNGGDMVRRQGFHEAMEDAKMKRDEKQVDKGNYSMKPKDTYAESNYDYGDSVYD